MEFVTATPIQSIRGLRSVCPIHPDVRGRGVVALTARVDSDGTVRTVSIVSGNRALAAAAVRANSSGSHSIVISKSGQPSCRRFWVRCMKKSTPGETENATPSGKTEPEARKHENLLQHKEEGDLSHGPHKGSSTDPVNRHQNGTDHRQQDVKRCDPELAGPGEVCFSPPPPRGPFALPTSRADLRAW